MDPPADSWGMIDNDTSTYADHGYGDWVELPGGDVYVVNYIVDTAPVDRPQIRGYRLRSEELFSPQRTQTINFAPPTYRRGKLAGQCGWVRQIPQLWRTTEWLEHIDYGPLGNNVIIDSECMTGSRNVGGHEEVVRLDVGPYDLEREVIKLSVVHRGRQAVAILRLDDQDANTILELRSDLVYDQLWASDNRSVPYLSGIQVADDWWRTTIFLDQGQATLATRQIEGDSRQSQEDAWATIVPDDTYQHHSAFSAVVVALGDSGGFYIDSIEIDFNSANE